jgi:hypothetical protein
MINHYLQFPHYCNHFSQKTEIIYSIMYLYWINTKIQHENKLCILNCLELTLLHIRNIKNIAFTTA